jgi:hypothetical protein
VKPEIILGNSGSANRYPNNPYPKFLQPNYQSATVSLLVYYTIYTAGPSPPGKPHSRRPARPD